MLQNFVSVNSYVRNFHTYPVTAISTKMNLLLFLYTRFRSGLLCYIHFFMILQPWSHSSLIDSFWTTHNGLCLYCRISSSSLRSPCNTVVPSVVFALCYHFTLASQMTHGLSSFSRHFLRCCKRLISVGFWIIGCACSGAVNKKLVHPVSIHLLKVNNKNSRTRCEICSKLTIFIYLFIYL